MPLRMTQAEVDAYTQKLSQWRSGIVPKAPGRRKKHGPCEWKLPEIWDGVMSVTLPLKLVNGANQRECWREAAKRAKAQREIVAGAIPRRALPPLPAIVRITRMGPRLMDDDGNTIAAKHVRDAIADLFCLDDSSPLLAFEYAQERGDYGVMIQIRPRGDHV